MKFISVDDLQAYCDNQKDHAITPNDFQRMNHLEIVRCGECANRGYASCPFEPMWRKDDDWFCAEGELAK